MQEILAKLKELTGKKHIQLTERGNKAIKIALDLASQTGNPLTSNVVLLGSLAKTENFPISLEQLKVIVPKAVPKKAIEANLKALTLGYETL